jgi:hypothetical protein
MRSTQVRAHLEGLCSASPPDADCELAGPAVCQHVSSGCADGLDTRAAAPLACQCIICLIQLPAPQPVHVGQGCGGSTAQACTYKHSNTHCGGLKHILWSTNSAMSLQTCNTAVVLGCWLYPHRLKHIQTTLLLVTPAAISEALLQKTLSTAVWYRTCCAVDVDNPIARVVCLGQCCHCLWQLLAQVTA